MKKLALSIILVLLFSVQIASAANEVALAPFQINAGNDLAYLKNDLPKLIQERLEAKGLKVIMAKNANVTNNSEAMNIAKASKTDYILFGSFNQIGDSFNISANFLNSTTNVNRPIYIEKNSLIELLPAVDELSSRIASSLINADSIADIEVRGLKVMDPDMLITRMNIAKGDAIDNEAIDNEIRNVWNMGYFSDVNAEVIDGINGKTLVINVVEKPRIDNVTIQGSDAVKKADILAAMSSKTGSVLNEKLLAEDINKITELYRQKGYYLAKVDYSLSERNDGLSATLIFNVTEGNKLYIKEVRVDGLSAMKRSDLNDYLALKTRGILSWFTNTGVLKEDLLERDAQAIQAYGLGIGLVDIQVSAPEVIYEEDGIIIIYRVNEGKRYKLGTVGVAGDLIDSEEVFLNMTNLDDLAKKNGYFALAVLQKDMETITNYYTDYGYAFANVDIKSDQNREEAIINIIYNITSKDKVYIRRVEVEGNKHTRDNVILREVRLADGDLFSGAKLRRTNERLQRTGYFKEVNSELVPTEVENEMDLLIQVEDAPTGSAQVGFGYSSFSKFGVSGSLSEQNLFGKGYYAGIEGYLAQKAQSVTARFVNPRIYDTNLGTGLSLYKLIEEWSNYSKDTLGGQLNVFYPLGEYSSVSLGYRLEQYKIYDVSKNAAPSISDYIGTNLSSAVSLTLSRDSTNSARFPTKGSVTEFTTEYAGGGIGGDDNFIKNVLEWGYYYGINNTNVIHTRFGVGIMNKNSSKNVPAFDRFYLGGMSTIRGYDYEDISPYDEKSRDYIGADQMAYASIEYIWQFESDIGLSIVPFFDMGWQKDTMNNAKNPQGIMKSVGLELRWNSPMGDLRFAYGFPLDKTVKGKKTGGRFEFAMGQFF